MSTSSYNQKDQGQQNPKGKQPALRGGGQNPSPKPGQQDDLPDRSDQQNQPDQGGGQKGGHGN